MTTHSMENIEQWNKIDRNRTMLRVFQYCVVFILTIIYQINNTIYLCNIKSFFMASPSNKFTFIPIINVSPYHKGLKTYETINY